MRNKINILDTTLRDGNYAIDFQFTTGDTEVIALALEKAGFRWIEIGHGLGLNASAKGKGAAAATDKEYLESVRNVIRKAKYGMFFIPGIGRLRDIRMAKDRGMSFIRIGTNANEVKEAKKYIQLAKKEGYFVFSNLMKSYALSPEKLANMASMAEDFGADTVCIVDSAGGMLPEDVERYFNKVKKKVTARLGFHGHNNLYLAVANTLKAIDCGATIVDTSLQGMGRSGGNAPTETLATILARKGLLSSTIDIAKTIDMGGKLVRPFLHKYGINPIDVTLGYAQFHSSFMSNISQIAKEYDVNERELVLRVSSKDRLAPSKSLIREEARKEKYESRHKLPKTFVVKRINIASEGVVSKRKITLKSLVKRIGSFSKRTGKLGILNVVFPKDLKSKALKISPFVQEGFSYVVGTIEPSSVEHIKKIANAMNGVIDYLLFDLTYATRNRGNLVRVAKRILKNKNLLIYNDYRAWINTVTRELCQLVDDPAGLDLAIFGDLFYTLNTALSLAEMGISVTLHVDKKDKKELNDAIVKFFLRKRMRLKLETDPVKASTGKDVLIGFSPGRFSVTKEMAARMNQNGIIIDAGLGSIEKEVISHAYEKDIKVVRVDMRPVIAGEIASSIGIKQLVDSYIGKRTVKGRVIASGGFIGRKGDVIVDSVQNPTKVIGVARGDGTVEYENLKRYKKDIEAVEREILTKKVLLKA